MQKLELEEPRFERHLTPKEVCFILGISYKTLRNWIRAGKIRAVRTPGGRFRIPASSVQEIINAMFGEGA